MKFTDFPGVSVVHKFTPHVWVSYSAKNGQKPKNLKKSEIFTKFPKFWRGFHANPFISHGARFAQSLSKIHQNRDFSTRIVTAEIVQCTFWAKNRVWHGFGQTPWSNNCSKVFGASETGGENCSNFFKKKSLYLSRTT